MPGNLPWIQVVLWLMSGWNPFLKAQDFLYDATRRILEARRKESDAGKKVVSYLLPDVAYSFDML